MGPWWEVCHVLPARHYSVPLLKPLFLLQCWSNLWRPGWQEVPSRCWLHGWHTMGAGREVCHVLPARHYSIPLWLTVVWNGFCGLDIWWKICQPLQWWDNHQLCSVRRSILFSAFKIFPLAPCSFYAFSPCSFFTFFLPILLLFIFSPRCFSFVPCSFIYNSSLFCAPF